MREVDGSGDTISVWALTRKAMLPQVSFMIGPMCSGKTTLGVELSKRTNSKSINFDKFVSERGIEDSSDDAKIMALVQELSQEICPRVLIEDFPKTCYQAQFFVKNACDPTRVYVLNCSKDYSQERMLSVPETSEKYLPSSLLSKKIGIYNQNLVELLPYLRTNTVCSEINTEGSIKTAFKEMCSFVEPTIINVRSSGSKDATATKNSVIAGLLEQGFMQLEVNDLIQLEVQRQTEVGRSIQDLLNAG